MKTSKEVIYQLIEKYCLESKGNDFKGLLTKDIASQLGMQRPNVSAILNILVAEGKIEKNGSRPVYYTLKTNKALTSEQSCFAELIGHDTTLSNCIKLAKAAVLYPSKSLNTIITGPKGSGKSTMAKLMHSFAIESGILDNDSKIIKCNCLNYLSNQDDLKHNLFDESKGDFVNYFDQAEGNILLIDNVDYMESKSRDELNYYLSNNKLMIDNDNNRNVFLILTCSENDDKYINDDLFSKVTIKINLPSLSKRTLEERFQFINHFFIEESINSKKTINANSEVIRCLLLYNCSLNIKQLRSDIKIACANAFVRNHNQNIKSIDVYLNDFENYVRKGLLNYKKLRIEVEAIIPDDYTYSFDGATTSKTININDSITMYETIELEMNNLKERGFQQDEINLIIGNHLKNTFNKYNKQLASKVINSQHLLKLVDEKIINLVSEFLTQCSTKFNVVYPDSVFYGLSLHIASVTTNKRSVQQLSNYQIMEIIQQNNDEYLCCLELANEIEKIFNISLAIDEVVLLTMFIIDIKKEDSSKQPQVLMAMHGSQSATSIAQVVNSLVQGNNTHSFDLTLDSDIDEAYESLKEKIKNIDQKCGVLVIYDMGSLKTMLESIEKEINVEIRTIYMPITLIAIDAARKCLMDNDIDNIYHSILSGIKTENTKKDYKPEAIITLCHTGEGGAVQLNEYIKKYSNFNGDIIPLAISDKKRLVNEVKKIAELKEIIAFVGTYNPKLFAIPFVSISEIMQANPKNIDKVIRQIPIGIVDVDYESIYAYLDEQLEFVSISKLENILPKVIEEIKLIETLSEDQELGLFVHIACLINRILGGEPTPININSQRYQEKYQEEFKQLLKVIKKIEKAFKIIISDDEIITILSIMKRV